MANNYHKPEEIDTKRRQRKLLCPVRRPNCIDQLLGKMNVSECRVCVILGQHRSTQRHRPRGRADEERLVVDMIELTRQHGRTVIAGLALC